jgi:small-conductance mechanosensitive channel
VSGLILLWERPIRVGDLVVVGDGEGYVRKISVRATEIETFDRSTVIVPNSTLISGTVRNRVRGHRFGRVIVPVNIGRDQDPARAAAILTAEAARHPDVVTEPPPRVVFKKIGDAVLEFELVCIVEDVARQLAVQSDLNFAIFKALTGAGIIPMPVAPGPVTLAGLEPVGNALQGIADAIGVSSRLPHRPISRMGEGRGEGTPSPAELGRR